jgi:dynein heavy chain
VFSFFADENLLSYNEIIQAQQRDKLKIVLDSLLQTYNKISKKPLDIVIFDYAISHFLRIHRIIKLDRGNGLLIGLGGSGRQSLTALAAYSS